MTFDARSFLRKIEQELRNAQREEMEDIYWRVIKVYNKTKAIAMSSTGLQKRQAADNLLILKKWLRKHQDETEIRFVE